MFFFFFFFITYFLISIARQGLYHPVFVVADSLIVSCFLRMSNRYVHRIHIVNRIHFHMLDLFWLFKNGLVTLPIFVDINTHH
jgi:hypothetical protein